MEDINNTNTPITPIISKTNIFKYLFFISTIIFLIVFIYLYLNKDRYCQKNLTQQINKSSEISTSPSPTNEELKWANADMGIYSFNYPVGWHVANFFRNEKNIEMNIIINSKPINTGARGGPLGDIVLFEQPSSENPEIVFQETIDTFKKQNVSSKEEILNTEIGKIYHFITLGHSEMTGKDTYNDRYYLLVKPSSNPDNINKRNIYIETDDQKNSDTLRKIVMSLKTK